MAGEFVHINTGDGKLTESQWLGLTTHNLGSAQAAGDIIYATGNTATPIIRLPIGASGSLLTVSAGLPSWNTTLNGAYIVNGSWNVTGGITATALTINGTLGATGAASAATGTFTNLVFTNSTGSIVQFSPVTSHGTYSGVTVSVTSSIAVTAGQVGFLNASAQFASGCATAVAKLPVTHIAVANVAAGSAGVFLSYGYYANNTFDLLVGGSPFYAATGLDHSSISSAAPATGVSGCIQRLGTAYSATAIYFNPSMDVFELV
jgi:hypothetical protein